ncbi:hypothetical protein [Shewanella halotolerans]|uniref:hypothetical protein n=1 Tax=Shewanella halotolerans TaxID=2864204 RepID=UPI001C66201B|nr:hypothetical protein [Shewanella halotolerans]QYJ90492.1 hypothetical protein K0H81_02510 [Shewanella halotolerans]
MTVLPVRLCVNTKPMLVASAVVAALAFSQGAKADETRIRDAQDKAVIDATPKQKPQCTRRSDYDIYLSGIHTGTMSRTEQWQGKQAVVTSNSEASILGIGTRYRQRAELSWSEATEEWITQAFHQQVSGFRARDMQVHFSHNGRAARVDLDGEVTDYHSKDKALRDVDTLAIEMRRLLMQGRHQFALVRQASDAMEPYQFYVKPPQAAEVAPWGELMLVPVEQTGAEEVTYYFAPELDYQLIKARYHGILLQGLIELNHYSSSCDLAPSA